MKQVLQQIAELDEELEVIKVLCLSEILKSLPESMLIEEDGTLIQAFVPNLFVNRFKGGRECKLSQRIWEQLTANEQMTGLEKAHSKQILGRLSFFLDSQQYSDRVAASDALKELCEKIGDDQI